MGEAGIRKRQFWQALLIKGHRPLAYLYNALSRHRRGAFNEDFPEVRPDIGVILFEAQAPPQPTASLDCSLRTACAGARPFTLPELRD